MKLLLKLSFTLAAFWLALRNITWEQVSEAAKGQEPIYLAAAAFLVLVQTLMGGLRWHMIRRAIESDTGSAPRTALIYYISNFFNLFMPSTIGSDAARVLMLTQDGSRTGRALYGVVLDRLMSLLGIAALVATTLPLLAQYFSITPTLGYIGAVTFWLLFLLGYALLLWLSPRLKILVRFAWLNDATDALIEFLKNKKHFALALIFAATAHICFATAGYALSLGLNMEMGWSDALVLLPLVLFIATMPVSIGGWGVREMSMVHALALVGVPGASALLLSLQLGVISMLVGLGGGAFYLLLKRRANAP